MEFFTSVGGYAMSKAFQRVQNDWKDDRILPECDTQHLIQQIMAVLIARHDMGAFEQMIVILCSLPYLMLCLDHRTCKMPSGKQS